jgi:phenylacetate-CoA ligase
MLTLDRLFMAGVAYYSGLVKLGAKVIRSGPGVPALQFELMERFQTTVLVAVPTFVLKLIEFAVKNNFDLKKTSVKKIVCIGEAIRDEHWALNALGKKITSAWNVDLVSTYASTEMQTAFCECSFGNGGHLLPDLVYAEVLDAEGRAVNEGEVGELVITSLRVEAMPLVRFATGDMVFMKSDPCACGRTTPRISPVLGRKNQLIKLKGTTIYPQNIFDVLNPLEEVKDSAVVVSKTDVETDDVLIKLVLSSTDHRSALEQISEALLAVLRVQPKLEVVSEVHMYEIQNAKGGRKPLRFIDQR